MQIKYKPPLDTAPESLHSCGTGALMSRLQQEQAMKSSKPFNAAPNIDAMPLPWYQQPDVNWPLVEVARFLLFFSFFYILIICPYAYLWRKQNPQFQGAPTHQQIQGGQIQGGPGDAPLTNKEVFQLIGLKGQNKSWKDIAAELKRSEAFIKAVWKDMQPDGEEKGKENQGKKDKSGNQQNNDSQKQNNKQGKKPREMNVRIPYPEPDRHLSRNEIKLLREIIKFSLNDLWETIATAFENATGRLVHPLDLEQKFTGIELGESEVDAEDDDD
ncbi:hypothetical protein BT63DRAFT_174653 [Microthyrium microscopicum]|uniref:Myb-like domain-containing protein n=1 Tax=Microthyrium microscopicum TaxID=703497 RepID=A0A6A6UII6_9PEZI|nr:hypothetical protein BT63DRAFT_174653 [Microthyrium microscopicum]